MDLSVGPNFFFWTAEALRAFYHDLARRPVARVILGEVVCSKRLPLWQETLPGIIAALQDGGKTVALSTLALITLKRESRLTADLFDLGLPVEINDLGALSHLPNGHPFWVGPLVNVYNEGSVRWLARRGATRICLPPELPLASIEVLAKAAQDEGVAIEVWGHGRVPLAISARCYHARLHDLTRDACQFVCGKDPDGRDVDTLDGQKFLTVNGVQTLSQSTACMARLVESFDRIGVSSLRLSPQSTGFDRICEAWHDRLAGRIDTSALIARLRPTAPGGHLSDGFPKAQAGVSWAEA